MRISDCSSDVCSSDLVANHSGEIADQEDHLVAEVLELPHLVEQHGVADVQVRRGRVEAGLDPQRPARLQPCFELLALENLVGTARRSEEHTSELQSLMRISYDVFCLNNTKDIQDHTSLWSISQIQSSHVSHQLTNTRTI